jgi:dUTPase
MKIAQLVVVRHEHAELEESVELPASKRSQGGFGSTGLSLNKA